MIKVFLDDLRNPTDIYAGKNEDWIVVRNIKEFTDQVLCNGKKLDIVSFDHDLTHSQMNYYVYNLWDQPAAKIDYKSFPYDQKNTGYDCAQLLIRHCVLNDLPLPHCNCHSANHIGKANIEGLFEFYKNNKDKDKYTFFEEYDNFLKNKYEKI